LYVHGGVARSVAGLAGGCSAGAFRIPGSEFEDYPNPELGVWNPQLC
jgi:hypothetical protein